MSTTRTTPTLYSIMNETSAIFLTAQQRHFLSTNSPFYYTPRPDILSFFPDYYLSLAAPVIAYWASSCFFHILDISSWRWLDKYRLHESSEVKSKNLVTKVDVIKAVIFQQVIQTILGLWWMEGAVSGAAVDHLGHMEAMLPIVSNVMNGALGQATGKQILEDYTAELLYIFYWWVIPIGKFFLGM